MNEVCIIGAGVAGISLAEKINSALIIEKSRATGGRLASRRLGNYNLNHGPNELQIYSEHITDPHGWIKKRANELKIIKSWEVSHIEVLADKNRIISTGGEIIESRKVILAIPAPQALLILKRSGLNANFLESVRYKAAIQFMLLAEASVNTAGLEKYLIKKRETNLDANLLLTLYELREQFTDEYIEKDRDEIKSFFMNKIQGSWLDSHVHKWRYSEVLTSIAPEFQTNFKAQNILLAGDYFGLKGVESSIASIQRIYHLC